MVSSLFKLWCAWRVVQGASAVCAAAPYVAAGCAGLLAVRALAPPAYRVGRAMFSPAQYIALPPPPRPTW